MNTKKKLPLAFQILIGLFVGIVMGLILLAVPNGAAIATDYLKPLGTIFLNLLKFIVVPIVLLSIAAGVISMQDIRRVGAIGGKTLVYYMLTTAFAVTLALILANVARNVGLFPLISTSGAAYEAKPPVPFMQTLVNIFPSNPIAPLASAEMLQVIVISLFLGFGVILAGEKGRLATQVIESFSEVAMKIMDMIIRLSPYGVAFLIAPVVVTNGPQVLGNLFMVLLVAYIGYAVHAVLVYSFTVKTLAGISPIKFFKEALPAMLMGFSTTSSAGTLPVTLECAQNMGARKDIASFVLPLGATINMDGTAIYQGVCAIFIASCYGIELSLGAMVTIVLTATIASIGTAGTPGAGMIMLAMVLESVGLPIEGIALVAGIDRLFDMGRTAINVTGDMACAVIVSRLDEKKKS